MHIGKGGESIYKIWTFMILFIFPVGSSGASPVGFIIPTVGNRSRLVAISPVL